MWLRHPLRSAVAGRLKLEHLSVATVIGEQGLVRAGFDDLAFLQDDDAVGHAHGREAVRNQERRFAGAEIAEALEYLILGAGVERRCRLVENEYVSIAHIGPRDGDLLPFPA